MPINYSWRALDIGCGAGRHLDLMDDFGLKTTGVDFSKNTRHGHHGDMRALPFDSETFDLALAYGVFYYGSRSDMEQAIAEMHRVMRPGGHGFVCLRSPGDWRCQFGIEEGDPEHGMEMTFVSGPEIPELFGAFSSVAFEWSEWSAKGRTHTNSDWLIQVTK